MNKTLFSITKEHLTKYTQYKITIKKKQELITEINAKLDGLKATDYSNDKIKGTANKDEKIVNLLDKKHRAEEIIKDLIYICKYLEMSIDALPELEKIIITMYYIENHHRNKRTWIAIAYETNYSEKQCRNLRDKAIETISVTFQ